MKRIVPLSLLLFLFAAVVSAQSVKKDDAAIGSLIKKMTDAQTSFDQKALDALFTADYIEISPAGEFDERSKVLGFYTPQAKAEQAQSSATVESSELSTRYYDKVAVAIVKLTFNIDANGQSLPPRSMRATIVCRKENGVWKIASTHYTGIRPPTPPKS